MWLLPVALCALALSGLGGAYFAGAFKLKTPDGTVLIDNVPNGAEVTVEGATVTVTRKGETVTVGEVPADGRGHRLRISKGGAELFAQDVTVKVGGELVRLRYEPGPVAPQAPAGPAPPTAPAMLAVPAAPERRPAPGGFAPLFNGKDLAGWHLKPDRPGNWRVEAGALVASGEPVGLLLSDRGDYENFHARARAMVNEGGDSGLYFRNSAAGGYEAQICCTPGRATLTGSLFRFPPGNHVLERVGARRTRPGEWFDLDVIAEGDRVRILVNGDQVVDRTVKVNPLTRGGFALQQAGAATEVCFRSVEVRELPRGPAPADPARP